MEAMFSLALGGMIAHYTVLYELRYGIYKLVRTVIS